MGSVWLTDLADVLRRTGFPVIEYPGWRTRSRASGGLTTFNGLSIHHTAESPLSDGKPSADYNALGAPAKPISNVYLDRGRTQPGGRPTFWCMAAGATNTVGAGTWIPAGVAKDQGNPRTCGLEIGNNGVGESYSAAQQDAVFAYAVVMYDHYGDIHMWDNADLTEIFAHFEYSPGRKCDPTGLSRWSNDGNKNGCNGQPQWNMNLFRSQVRTALLPVPEPPKPDPIPPTPTPEDDDMPRSVHLVASDANGNPLPGYAEGLLTVDGSGASFLPYTGEPAGGSLQQTFDRYNAAFGATRLPVSPSTYNGWMTAVAQSKEDANQDGN